MQHQTTYEYNHEYSTLVQLRNGAVVHSMYIPEQDLGKLSLLLWSIEVDSQIENLNEDLVETT